MNISGTSNNYIYGVKTTNSGGKRDRLARRRWILENPYPVTNETLGDLETTLQHVIDRNIPAHVTPPRGERYPGQVLLINARVFASLLEAARKGIENEHNIRSD